MPGCGRLCRAWAGRSLPSLQVACRAPCSAHTLGAAGCSAHRRTSTSLGWLGSDTPEAWSGCTSTCRLPLMAMRPRAVLANGRDVVNSAPDSYCRRAQGSQAEMRTGKLRGGPSMAACSGVRQRPVGCTPAAAALPAAQPELTRRAPQQARAWTVAAGAAPVGPTPVDQTQRPYSSRWPSETFSWVAPISWTTPCTLPAQASARAACPRRLAASAAANAAHGRRARRAKHSCSQVQRSSKAQAGAAGRSCWGTAVQSLVATACNVIANMWQHSAVATGC